MIFLEQRAQVQRRSRFSISVKRRNAKALALEIPGHNRAISSIAALQSFYLGPRVLELTPQRGNLGL
jgi:hypothetical protein